MTVRHYCLRLMVVVIAGALEPTVRANGYTTSVQSISLTADQTVNVALIRGAECSALTFDGLRASDRFATYPACGSQ